MRLCSGAQLPTRGTRRPSWERRRCCPSAASHPPSHATVNAVLPLLPHRGTCLTSSAWSLPAGQTPYPPLRRMRTVSTPVCVCTDCSAGAGHAPLHPHPCISLWPSYSTTTRCSVHPSTLQHIVTPRTSYRCGSHRRSPYDSTAVDGAVARRPPPSVPSSKTLYLQSPPSHPSALHSLCLPFLPLPRSGDG